MSTPITWCAARRHGRVYLEAYVGFQLIACSDDLQSTRDRSIMLKYLGERDALRTYRLCDNIPDLLRVTRRWLRRERRGINKWWKR